MPPKRKRGRPPGSGSKYKKKDEEEYFDEVDDVKVKIEEADPVEKYSDVGADISRLLNDVETADLTLKSNESSREFRVHRTILAARSSVFREMLFPESVGSGSGERVVECAV